MAFAKPASKPLPVVKKVFTPAPFFVEEETHDFIHYDTLYDAGAVDFRLRISRPANMFTPGHPDTASRPVFIHMGGKGETGTNYALLRSFGPHYWLYRTSGGSIDSATGWDGGIYTDGGTKKHFPIIISAQYSTVNGDVKGDEATNLINFLLNTYHIKRSSVHLMGLSMGAFTWVGMLNWSATAGGNTPTLGEDGMKLIKSVVALQGQSDLWSSSTIGTTGSVYTNTGYQFAGRWASKYGGKFFGLEGTNDERNVWKVQKNMNDSVPGSAYFAYENFDNLPSQSAGSHCCWNKMYSPYKTDWKSTGSPLGGNITTGGFPPNPNSEGTYRNGDNIFTWSFKQGDTSFVGTSTPARKVIGVAVSEYKNAFHYNDSTVWSYTNGTYQKYDLGARKVVKVATGFNTIQMLDDQGYVWSSVIPTSGPATNIPTRIDTDTTGAAFNNNISIYGCGAVGGGNIRPTFCSIRSDSSVWYWGHNNYNFFGGARPIKPIQLSPGGMKFKKIAMSYYKIVGLTTAGDVYEWVINGSTTPTQKTLPRPAIDIDVPYFDAAVAIVPKATGSQTMGYPFWWGNAFNMWGGSSATSTPTERWSLTVPIKEIACGYHTTHYIDSLSRLFGIGENAQGEIGIGTSIVDRWNYTTPWRWTYTTGESMVNTPTQVGIGTDWKNIWGDNTLSFYKYAQDVNDSIYFDGRDKAYVGGRGYLILQEETYPNTIDVKSFTMVTPGRVTQSYNFTPGTANAGPDNSTSGTTITLDATATASTILANGTVNNGIASLSPSVTQYNWTQVSGPSCTISSANTANAGVSGMNTIGTYVFRLVVTMTDGSTVSDTVSMTKTAAPAIPPHSGKARRGGRIRVQ